MDLFMSCAQNEEETRKALKDLQSELDNYDATIKELQTKVDTLNHMEEGTRKVVTVQEVANAVPSETKEETDVLRSLEAQQPPNKSFTDGILEGVPEQASHVFSNRSKVRSFSKSSGPAATFSPQADTVEEELHGLVGELDDNGLRRSSKVFGGNMFGKFAGDADKLIEKARVIDYKKRLRENARDTYVDFRRYLGYQKASMWSYSKWLLLLTAIGLGLAALLFYLGKPFKEEDGATVSWWILFFVRQMLVYTLTKATEAIVIDFLCLRHPILLRVLGPYLTLLLVQSKGWPFHMVFFSLYDFALLYGDRDFARHWMHYQTFFKLFSKANPAGDVTHAPVYEGILWFLLFAGLALSLKRFFMGLWYGQKVYQRYGKDLGAVMKKCVFVKKMAKYAKASAEEQQQRAESAQFDYSHFSTRSGETGDEGGSTDGVEASELLIKTHHRNMFEGGLAASQELKIKTLLGEWEEPSTDDHSAEYADISAIVQFRTAVSCIDRHYPFSTHFGLADTRENCIDSSQKLYLRLKKADEDFLTFDRIVVIAAETEGQLDENQVKSLVKLLRPTREGEISMLDFVKSIDAVYKELRMLYASIANVQQMNAAFQRLWDIIFNFFLFWVFLLAIQVNAVALLSSFTAFIVGFSFMFGSALSKAFEGLLLVLVRKPYDVGDRIAVASIGSDASGNGSSGWIVKDVDLYKTTVVYGTTGEEACYTNGYLNGYRIINMNRSPKAVLSFVMKFGIDVSKDKIDAFGTAVESFVRDRPREWLSFSAYRLTGVAADLGYVEYKVVLQHRESWQQIGALLNSKAAVHKFAFELTQDLGMGYRSPPMPIILDQSADADSLEGLGAALTKKNA